MSNEPYIPLRWYETALLRFLLKSPRIDRIIVQQNVIEDDDDVDDEQYECALRAQLEDLYQGPSAEEYREG
jgi:hypothetical protein